uniref:F-box domain-containing protein n=1 Tax=Caenorhabditis tropicalis TaxID=1561998 RepID=A0A1I7TT63_9PELO
MDRFPLFRLPSVAVSEVMKKFHLFDLTILSMCSKKTQKWIKAFHPYRDDFEVGVWLCRDFNSVTITKQNKYLDYRITSNPIHTSHSAKFDNSVVPMSIETHERGYQMNLYFEDEFDGLKVVTEYFCWLFKKDIYSLNYNTSIDLDQAENVMDWVSKRQKRFHSLFADCGITSDDVAEYLFSKVNIGEDAYISLEELSETFEADFEFEGDSFTLYPCPCYDELVTMRGGFDIKRNDGKTATIAYYEEDEINEYDFRMIVWEFQEQ